MRLIWEWAHAPEKESPPQHPILSMADWLYDPIASRQMGRARFRLPYPGGNWVEEKRNNEYLLFLMERARTTARVGWKHKKGKKLTEEEDKFLEEIAEVL